MFTRTGILETQKQRFSCLFVLMLGMGIIVIFLFMVNFGKKLLIIKQVYVKLKLPE